MLVSKSACACRNRSVVFAVALIAATGLCCFVNSPAHAQAIFNGHSYLFTTNPATWADAEAQAVSMGGHLVAINDASEQAFLNTVFNTNPVTTNTNPLPLWIGLNDQASKGNFVWSDGDPLTYTNWNANVASNPSSTGDYVAMNWDSAHNAFYPSSQSPNTVVGDWHALPANGLAYRPEGLTMPRGVIELPYVTTAPTGSNLLSNPNFSQGNTGFSTGYTYVANSSLASVPRGRYSITSNTGFADANGGNGNVLLVDGGTLSDEQDFPIWQDIVQLSGTGQYSFSFYAASADSNDPNPAHLQVSINGQNITSSVTLSSASGNWQQITGYWNSNGASYANIQIDDLINPTSGNQFAVDRMAFSPISAAGAPEPPVVMLLGGITIPAALIGIARRGMTKRI